jgi:predicted transglutaminase-like cysteine proteinase
MTTTPRMRGAQKSVNARFTYISDQKNHGVSEHYAIPTVFRAAFQDDCDGYAMEMIAYLCDYDRDAVVAGLKSGVFKIHRVITERGNGHAVVEHNGLFIDNIGNRWRKDLLLDGWTHDKVRTWGQIQRKLWASRAGQNKGNLAVGAVALAVVVGVVLFMR